MNIQKIKYFYVFVIVILPQFNISIKAQECENELQSRIFTEFRFEPANKIKFYVIPELRFNKKFAFDESMVETELGYNPVSILSLGTSYRFIANQRENKDTEYLHRYAFRVTLEKKFNRFEPVFRMSYTNYADDESVDNEYLRYKLSLKYDIPNRKITPFVGCEVFHQLANKEIYKVRYIVGTKLKVFPKNYLKISYRYDSYQNENRARHILDVGYRVNL